MSLFVSNENQNQRAGGSQLQYTAKLTEQASTMARKFVATIIADEYLELNAAAVEASQTDNISLNELLEEHGYINFEDIDWLKEASKEELERMLKSQQSKRSRSKKASMTVENYIRMVTAAISENMIREAGDFGKLVNNNYQIGDLTLSDEQRQELTEDQELLRRAIRNIQSRKSILKKKEGFSEDSEQWLDLVEFEEQLKALRTSTGNSKPKVSEETKKAAESAKAAKELLEGVEDINKMKAADAKALLAKIEEALLTE